MTEADQYPSMNTRWWHIAVFGAAAAVLAVLLLGADGILPRIVAGGALIVFLLCWLGFGRFARDGDARALAFTAVTIATAGTLTACYPTLAIFQGIGYPLVWYLSGSFARAIAANVLLALSVGTGFVLSLWGQRGADALPEIAVTVALSLGFSIAIGSWITRISTLSEERLGLLEKLTAAQDELATLHRDAGAGSERERLARELHDTIAQSLTGIVLLAQRARRELDSSALDSATLELIEASARDALVETRTLVAANARVELTRGGLVDALLRLGERFQRESGIEVLVRADDVAELARDTEVVVLRAAQEGLSNVRKHAGAGRVTLELAVEAGSAALVVGDDGQGFDTAAPRRGFGLEGLRDRVETVGGQLLVESGAAGTRLAVRVPDETATALRTGAPSESAVAAGRGPVRDEGGSIRTLTGPSGGRPERAERE